MAGKEWAVFTVMCMLHDGKGNILVEDRRSSHWPGIAFPGGHVEPGESFVQAAVREMQEETGLDIQNPVLCGVKQFQTGDGARYVVFLFRADRFTGTLRSSEEGEVFWVPRAELQRYPLAADFAEMLCVFESERYSEFCYDDDGNVQLVGSSR